MSRTKMTGRKGLGAASTLGPRGRNTRMALSGIGENLESVADSLVQTWKPTGFYTVAEVNAILNAMEQVQERVNAVVDAGVGTSTSSGGFLGVSMISDDDKVLLRDVQSRTSRSYRDMVQPMIAGLRAAAAAGAAAVDAPQFRSLVIHYLYKAAWAAQTVQTMRSDLTWGQRAAEWIGDASIAAGNVARRVVGVTLDVLKAAGAAVVKIPDALGTIYTIAKWGGLAYGLWWIWQRTERAS